MALTRIISEIIQDNTVQDTDISSSFQASISGSFGNQRVGITDDVQFNHITASGNISSSGIVIADTFQSTGGSVDGISFTDDLNITGNITASGAISSSVGNFTTVNIDGGTVDGITSLTAGGDLDIGAHDFRAATLTADGLTAGRVPFAGTDGVLSDDSDLTFATDTLTATKIGAFTAAGAIDFDSQNMTNVDIDSGTITGITDLTVADGGTGVSTLTDGGVLLGSGAGAITTMSVLADSEMIVGDGSTDPVAESGATLRTSIGVGTTDGVQFTNITGSEVSSSTALFTTATIDKIGGAIDFNNENMTNVDIDSGTITGITDLVVADGGTGASTFTDGGVLLGSGTGAITAMAVLADSEIIVGDGSTDPVAESGATLRTSIGVGLTDDVVFSNVSGAAATFNSATINGLLTVEEIHTVFVSASVTVATGSNIFGDAIVDAHQFTGSIDQSGSLSTVDITSDNLFSSNITGSIISGSTALLTTATIDNIGAFKATGAIDFDNQNMTNVDIDSGVITGITDLVVADGGTGVSTLTDGGVLLGSGTSAITAMAVLTDGQMIVGDGTTDPVAESGATLRTSIGVGTTDDVKFANITGSGNISGSSTSTGSFGSVVGLGNSNSFGETTLTGNLSIGGTTPILTVGDGGAEDAKITFDGNENNFTIGLDDSSNKLTIVGGSNLNALQMLTIDENGLVTLPDNHMVINASGNGDNLTLTSTDADANVGPNLRMYRNSSSPANDDFLGAIEFEGRNNNTQDVIYGSIYQFIDDITDGSEDGAMYIKTMLAGTLRNTISLLPTEIVFNDEGQDVNFRVEGSGAANALFVQGSDGKVGIGTAAPDTALTLGESGASSAMKIFGATNGNPLTIYEDTDSSIVHNFYFDSSDNGGLGIYANGASQKVNIGTVAASPTYFNGGKVGIGTATPDYLVEIEQANGDHTSTALSITNSQAGGYGSSLNFISERSDDNAHTIAARIRTQGEAAWNSDANTDSNLFFSTIKNNTLTDQVKIDADGDLITKRIHPVADGTHDLGDNTLSWRKVYTDNILFNGDSADANALDDYEEGTWTPQFFDATSGGVQAGVATATGIYVKVGSLVNLTCEINVNSLSGITMGDAVILRNLPFPTKASTSNMYPPIVVGYATALNITAGTSLAGYLNSNGSSYGVLTAFDAAGGITDLSFTELSDNANLTMSMTYRSTS